MSFESLMKLEITKQKRKLKAIVEAERARHTKEGSFMGRPIDSFGDEDRNKVIDYVQFVESDGLIGEELAASVIMEILERSDTMSD